MAHMPCHSEPKGEESRRVSRRLANDEILRSSERHTAFVRKFLTDGSVDEGSATLDTAKRRQVPRLRASLVGVCCAIRVRDCSPPRLAYGERTPSVPSCQYPARTLLYQIGSR